MPVSKVTDAVKITVYPENEDGLGMSLLKSRNRLVSFRLSAEEYDALKQVCIASGARSISDFARESVLHGIETRRGGRTFLGDDLATLSFRLEELDGALKNLSELIARVLGARGERAYHGGPNP